MARKDEIVRVLAQEERAILDKIDEEVALEQTFVNFSKLYFITQIKILPK